MNCVEFRKWMGAFVDGELDTERNLDALEHLRMCPPCAMRVDVAHALRRAIARQEREPSVPPALFDRIVDDLNQQDTEAVTDLSVQPRALRFLRRRPWNYVALAAVLAMLSLASREVWWPWVFQASNRTKAMAEQVTDIRDAHQRCCSLLDAHRGSGLPSSPAAAATELARELRIEVLMPDLSSYGYDFVGACSCRLRGHNAAHGLYRARITGDYLSIFTVHREAGCRPSERLQIQGQTYYVYEHNGCERSTVVAWCRGDQTYIWCGERCATSLIQIAGIVATGDP